MGFILEREIGVLGEPVCLKEAFLKTSAGFEHPAIGNLVVSKDAREQPAECVVLLNDVGIEIDLSRDTDDFRFADHERPFFSQFLGTRKRQRVTSFAQSSAGSSLAYPFVSRSFAASISRPARGFRSARKPRRFKDCAVAEAVGIVNQKARLAVLAPHVLCKTIGNVLNAATCRRVIEHIDDRSVYI